MEMAAVSASTGITLSIDKAQKTYQGIARTGLGPEEGSNGTLQSLFHWKSEASSNKYTSL